jgi:acyl-CoA synthetase (AMP-forming)/AMP-acid ligase II
MVCCEKTKHVTIAWLGIFKIVAVLVPVDMRQPLARFERILNVSEAKAVVSTLQSDSKKLSENVCQIDNGFLPQAHRRGDMDISETGILIMPRLLFS